MWWDAAYFLSTRFFSQAVAAAAAVAVFLAAPASMARTIVDNDFAESDWTVEATPFIGGGGGIYVTSFPDTGGHPGGFLLFEWDNIPLGPNSVLGFISRTGLKWDPAVDGAVARVDWRFEYTLSDNGLFNVIPLIVQDNNTYIPSASMTPPGSPPPLPGNWPIAAYGAGAQGYEPLALFSTPTDNQPDFSETGGELDFTILFVGVVLQDNGINSRSLGIDNFMLHVTPVPEPATVTLLALGVIALLPRRRRRPPGTT